MAPDPGVAGSPARDTAGRPWNDPAWRESFDSWSTPAVVLTAGRDIARVNRAFASRIGKSVAECHRQHWDDLVGLDTGTAARTARNGEDCEVDLPALGGPHLVRARALAPAATDDGTVVVSLQELATTPSAEWRATELETWLALALDTGRIGTWDWDVPADRVYYVPVLGGDAGGLVVRETIGADWARWIHPEDLPEAAAAVERAVVGETDLLEYTARIKQTYYRGGQWYHIRSRGKVLARAADGRATRIVGVHQDISEVVHRRTLERAQEAALARAHRLTSLSALASSLAHEINQPLAALTSYLETAQSLAQPGDAQDPGRTEPLRQALEQSIGLVDRTSEIVRRLVRSLQRQEPVRERIAVGPLLEGVAQLLAAEASEARVSLDVSDRSQAAPLRGDRIQIEQVLINLGRNAIEALAPSDRPERRVTFSASREDGAVSLTVTDTGPGVPAAIRSRLFAPFFTTKAEGTGLGLMVCESIAELHGGQLRARFDLPGQTRFQLVLPL
jgi:signal transduction histidine kinase